MRKIAILIGILFFAQAAFAGGTILYTSTAAPMDGQYYDASYNASGAQETSSKTTREGKVRIGTQKNDPNSYWNYGAVNFGSGFSSSGASVKRY